MTLPRHLMLALLCSLLGVPGAIAQGTVLVDYVGEPREARILEEKGDQVKVEFRNALTGEWDGQDIRWKQKSDVHKTQPDNYNPNGYGNVNGALRPAGGGAIPAAGGNFVPNPGGVFPGANAIPNPGGAFPGANAIPNPGGAFPGANPTAAIPAADNIPRLPGGAIDIQKLRDMLPTTGPDRKTINLPKDRNLKLPPGKTWGGFITIEEQIRRQNGGAIPDLNNLPDEVWNQLQQPNPQPNPQQAQPQAQNPRPQPQAQNPQPEPAQPNPQAQPQHNPQPQQNPQAQQAQNPQPQQQLPQNPIPQFDGPPLTQNDIIDFLSKSFGDNPRNLAWGGPREKVYDDLMNMIKDRGTAFKGLEVASKFDNDLRFFEPHQGVIEAIENNFGAPVQPDWFFGSWKTAKHDFGTQEWPAGKLEPLKVGADQTYSFGNIQGNWVPASKEDLMNVGKGSGIVLRNFRDGRDWIMFKDDRMPGDNNIRFADKLAPQTQYVAGRM